jgi:hypothetical protein
MDTYTIFNQYETQKMTASIQGEYTFWENFSAMAMFLYTRFEGRASIYSGGDDYTVKYFSAGLKARF